MLKPILDRVLVKRLEKAKKPNSLIEIPDIYQQQNRRCEVVALGDFLVQGSTLVPLKHILAVGDIVMIGDYGDEPVVVDDVEFLLVRIQDIRGRETKDGRFKRFFEQLKRSLRGRFHSNGPVCSDSPVAERGVANPNRVGERAYGVPSSADEALEGDAGRPVETSR